ncbi:MAG TPA: hypothetical protein VIX91_17275 [Candidatus Acidoferrum sp.]
MNDRTLIRFRVDSVTLDFDSLFRFLPVHFRVDAVAACICQDLSEHFQSGMGVRRNLKFRFYPDVNAAVLGSQISTPPVQVAGYQALV